MDGTRGPVLVVGHERALEPRLATALDRMGRRRVIAFGATDAYELASASRCDLIVMDFDGLGDTADVAADALRAVAPAAWVLDFRGLVRRRPDHAPVSMSHTEPLILSHD